MKKFTLNLTFFLLLSFLIISLIGLRLERGKIFNNVFDQTRWNEFYSGRDSLDYIFVGSSHVYNSIIPFIIDSINNTSSFNLGSASQSPITSYYIINESIRKKKVKSIIFEVFPRILFNSDNFGNALINFDVIESVDIKTRLLFTGDNYSDVLEIFFPAYRYNNYLTTFFKYDPVEEMSPIDGKVITYYGGKGYLKDIALNDFKYKTKFDSLKIERSSFSEDRVKAIIDISNICKENDIKLYVVTTPLNPLYYKNINGYEIFHNYIDSLSIENNFEYIDGNYHPETGIVEKDFKDSGHLFYSGAVKFSTWFASRIKSNKEINSSFVLDVETSN